jgi:phosphoglycolate phosphatase
MVSSCPVEAIFFDLDGTLSDPYEGVARSVAFAFESLALTVPPDDELRSFIGPPLQVWLGARFGDAALVAEIVRRFRLRYAEVGLFENTLYPGVPEMLSALASSARLFVCTSKPAAYAVPIVQRFGIEAAFTRVYGSELDGTRIDKRALLAHALECEGIVASARVALLGDRDLDVRAARANGVVPWGAAWGYGSVDELRNAGVDHLFAAPAEVAALIARSAAVRAPDGAFPGPRRPGRARSRRPDV